MHARRVLIPHTAHSKGVLRVRGYSNPELDDLLDRQRSTFDEPERRRIVAQAQQIVARDLPLLHLFYPTGYRIFRKATFDQWPAGRNEPPDKQVLVTGQKSKELTIRPTR